jgi:hypothetical protein
VAEKSPKPRFIDNAELIKRDMTFLALNGARDARAVGSPTSGERRYENRSKIIVKFIRRDHYAWTSFSRFTPDDGSSGTRKTSNLTATPTLVRPTHCQLFP